MKQKKITTKKAMAFLLAVAMTVNLFPAFSTEVHAAELPDNTQFATADELLTSYDTNDSTNQPAKKIYFGQNGSGSAQEWWIVGKDNSGGLVLFAASPLTSAVFSRSTFNKTYNGQTVYANHYGASDLINTTLKGLETNTAYFSTAEQSLMMDTTVYTEDRKNGGNYSTMGKLYAVYGNYDDNQYVTAGTNSSDSLNGGLRIDMSYWGNSDFWLRAPNPDDYFRDFALVGYPDSHVDLGSVRYSYSVVPAFQLNLSSVLFASAAPAASSENKLQVNDAFTLRYNTSNLGAAQVAYDYTQVDLTGVPPGAYLVAQNKGGAWAKAVSGTTSVSASDMGIDSFENCRVWLETTDSSERKTYAEMATREWYDVNITGNENITISSNNGIQNRVKIGNAIAEITVKANNGYCFSDEYVTELNKQLGGLTVAKSDDFTLKISGAPTADVSLTLPAAAQIVYGMDFSGNGTFGSACVGYDSDKVMAQEFTIVNTGNVDLTNVQITIGGTDSGDFALTWENTATSIPPNGEIKVTVKPEDNLAVKEYQAQLSVSADNCTPTSKALQFNVTDHAYNDVVTPPSCTEKGYTTHTCQNCGSSYKDNETDIIPHSFGEWETIQSPTCVQGGSRKHVCTACGFEETENLNPDPDGHKWEDTPTVDKEPTCQNDGSQSIHCKNCDATKDSQSIPRADHKFTNYISDNDATCTKDGTKTAECDYGCGSTNTLPDDGSMLEHNYEWTYNNDAACEKNGTETGTCKDCGAVYTREKAGTALEHQPSGWIVDKEATATADGKKHEECTVCGKVLETKTIPATGTPGWRYRILEGADQTWKGNGNLTIKANGDFSKFIGIKVDKVAVDTSNYDAKSGSTVVTLKESYLAALSDGVHTLTLVYNDGEVSTNFTIAERETQRTPTVQADSEKGGPAAVRSPQTGDNADAVLWALFLVLSALLMAFTVQIRKQKTYLKHKRK